MKDIIVLKFGGSSVADNEKLKIVAEKIINMYEKNNNIVVILSAQGKMTDKLIEEAKELAKNAEKREMFCNVQINRWLVFCFKVCYRVISRRNLL